MVEVPEDVIRDAANAWHDAQGHHMQDATRSALAAMRTRDPEFRAAVKLAYRRGRASIVDRLAWLDDRTATIDRSVVDG